jgi:predicted Rossmann-fold nucleotide-binding protein
VFCGASSGSSPMYVEAAAALGAEMAARGIGLVYGVRSRVPFAAVALVARD